MYKELSLFFIALKLVNIDGRSVTSAPQSHLKLAIVMDIKRLLNDEHQLLEDKDGLYTPENTDDKCARETMKCYLDEIGALALENENKEIKNSIRKIKKNIEAVLNYTSNAKATGLNNIQPSEPSKVTSASFTSRREKDITAQMNVCPPCTSYQQQKTKYFLQHMIQFVQFALDN